MGDGTFEERFLNSIGKDMVDRVSSVDSDQFDKAMADGFINLSFDKLVEHSAHSFDGIKKCFDEATGRVSHFVFKNADLTRYQLFNILYSWAAQRTRSRSIKFWFIVDIGDETTASYIEMLKAMTDVEQISLNFTQVPPPSLEMLRKVFADFPIPKKP